MMTDQIPPSPTPALSNPMTELKPCPFCKEAAEIRSWDWPYVRFQVRCSRCRATSGGRKAIRAEAIAAWNTRAAEEGKAELVDAVQRWVDATDAITEFERDHPNDTTSRWERLFDERGFASDALRAALARVRGEG